MKKHVILVAEGEHCAVNTREIRLNLPENLVRDIELHTEGSPDSVYSILLTTGLRNWREGSSQVGCLGINAKEFLWKHGYILTEQEKIILEQWDRGEVPALEAVELLLKDHHGDTLAIRTWSLSPDPLITFPGDTRKPGEKEAEAFLRRLKGME